MVGIRLAELSGRVTHTLRDARRRLPRGNRNPVFYGGMVMSTTVHKEFLQRRTSVAAERKAYRDARRKTFKGLISREYAKYQASERANDHSSDSAGGRET